MKITIITAFLPYPLTSGGAQAQYNMIDGLRHYHKINIVFPVNGFNKYSALEELRHQWPEVTFHPYSYWRQLRHLPFLIAKIRRAWGVKLTPMSNRFQVSRVLKPYGYPMTRSFIRFINNIIKGNDVDVVQMEFYPYLRLINYLPTNIKRVFVHHEIKFVRNERLGKDLKLTNKDLSQMNKLKSDEISDLNKYDKIVTLTSVDKDILVNAGVKTPILVSPAAINTHIEGYTLWNKTLVFVGGVTHTPNVEGLDWLCRSVFPLIDLKRHFRCVKLKVIGKGWNRHQVSGLPKENICITGFVPQLKDAAYGGIMLVPILSGSGMRMKILEGMALGLPIVTTSVGKEGIDIIGGESCLVADTPELFAESVVRLMMDETLRKYLTKNAQKVFMRDYSKKALITKRNKVYSI